MRKKYRGPTRRERNSTIFHHGTSRGKTSPIPNESMLEPTDRVKPDRTDSPRVRTESLECFDPLVELRTKFYPRPLVRNRIASCTLLFRYPCTISRSRTKHPFGRRCYHPLSILFFSSYPFHPRKKTLSSQGGPQRDKRLSYRGKENLPRP